MNLTDRDIQVLVDYARRKFAEERYPLDPELRPICETIAKLDEQPQPTPPRSTKKR
jgi:hypothetical protein